MSRLNKRALRAAAEARGGDNFLPFTMGMLKSEAMARLSPYACKLLLDIASQWKLGHNGDANVAFESTMRARGWKSKATLYKALKEVLESGLIVKTRQGSMHVCSLFGLGWLAIDECDGKLDIAATRGPLYKWATPPLKAASSSTPRVPQKQSPKK